MSDSLSPSHSDDLIIDDEDLDSISVTMQDLTTEEDKHESPTTTTRGQVIARPGFLPHLESGTQASNGKSRFPVSSKISVADPRTKFKPSGFLSLDKSEDKNNFKVADLTQINNNMDNNFNIKRTVQNYSGATSFVKQLPAAPKQAISFGSAASASMQKTRRFKFGASFNSSPVTSTFDQSNEDGGEEEEELRIRRANQAARMKTEKETMEKIDNIIAMKKLEKQQQMWEPKGNPKMNVANLGEQRVMDNGQVARKERELALQEMEIKKQTTMLLQMQQNMLMEKRNAEEERRKLEDQRKIMELQMSVKNLERLITEKQGQGSYQPQGSSYNRPVKERVGEKRGLVVGEYDGQGFKEEEDLRSQRKRRFMEGRSNEFSNQDGNNSRRGCKKSKYRCAKLPDDLVLTEITDQGPVKKEDLREADRVKRQLAKKEMEEEEDDLDRYEYEGELDPELVLTEFSENGPVKAGSVDITSTFGK